MLKKTLSLLSLFLLCSCIKTVAADMIIVAKLYPNVCDFGVFVDDYCERPKRPYWYKLVTLKNDYQQKLFEQINGAKVPEKSTDFTMIYQLSKEIHDLECELDDDFFNTTKQQILEQKEDQLLEFCLNLKKFTCFAQ